MAETKSKETKPGETKVSVKKKSVPRLLLRGVRVFLSATLTLVILSQLALWSGFLWLQSQGGQNWLKGHIAPLLGGSGYELGLGRIGISIGSRLNIDAVTLDDGKGVFLNARNLTLGLDIPQLISLHQLDLSLSIAELKLLRLPAPVATEKTASGVFVWPEKYFTQVSLDKLHIEKLSLSPEVAGAAMEMEMDLSLDGMARPDGTDVLVELALEIKSEFQGLPEKAALNARLNPANGKIEITTLNLAAPFYDISGAGSLNTDTTAPVVFDLAARSKFPVSGGQARAEADIGVTGTPLKPDVKLSGIVSLPQGTADIDAIRFSGSVNAAGRGHLNARSAGQGKNASVSTDIAYGGNMLKLGNVKVEWPGISARGQADIGLNGGFQSAQVTLSKVTAGDLSFRNIKARLTRAAGDIYNLSLQAQSRSKRRLDVNGTIGISGNMPVNLSVKADHFEPFRHMDGMKGAFSGALTVAGTRARYTIAGTVRSPRLDITIPGHINASIPKLNIVSGRTRAGAAPDILTTIALNIQAVAERQVFVRGRGLDAEFGGKVAVTGTLAEPLFDGVLESRRGRYEAFGKRFDLTRARFKFQGPVPPSPYLDVLAMARAEDITATISLTGSAMQPAVVLSSVPPLPADEVLSRLLFGRALSKVTPLQAIQIANALKQFSGGGAGFDPLSMLRRATGLDDLQVNTDASGATGVGAGKYITDKVYIEGVTGTDGKTGAAKVQIELTPNIKAESKVGPGQGSGAAIFWQKDY